MPLPFQPACLGVAYGALPHRNPAQALALLVRTTPSILAWPQLPLRSFREQSYVQAAAGFPGLVYDGVEERVFVDSELLEQEVDQLSLAYLQGDTLQSGLSVEDAAGLIELLRGPGLSFKGRALKGQMIGPISLGVMLTNEQQRPLIYEPMLREAIAQHLHLRALWQGRQFAELAPATIICLEEPFLEAVESPFVPLAWEEAIELIERVFEGVQSCRALAVSGAVSWDHILETSTELLMVDLQEQREGLLAATKVPEFFERGGAIAWGVVPNDPDAIEATSAAMIVARIESMFDALAERGIARDGLPMNALISTCGSLERVPIAVAERAMGLVAEVSAALRDTYRLA